MEQNYGLADFRQPGIQNKEANSSLVMPDLVESGWEDLLNQTECKPNDYQLTVQPAEEASLEMPVVN